MTHTRTVSGTPTRPVASSTITPSVTETGSRSQLASVSGTQTYTATPSRLPSTSAGVSSSVTESSTVTATQTPSNTITSTLTATSTPSISLTLFSLVIPGNNVANAQSTIQRYIQTFVGNSSTVTLNTVSWNNGVYTVTGSTSSTTSISNLFPNSAQYQALMASLGESSTNNVATVAPYGISIGASIAGAAVLGIIAIGFYFIVRRRNRSRVIRNRPVVPTVMSLPEVARSDAVKSSPEGIRPVDIKPKVRNDFSPTTIIGGTFDSIRKLPMFVSSPPISSLPPPPQPSPPPLYIASEEYSTEFNPPFRMERKPSISDVNKQHVRLPLYTNNLTNPVLLERDRSFSEPPVSRLPSMTKMSTPTHTVFHPTFNAGRPRVMSDTEMPPPPPPPPEYNAKPMSNRLQFIPQKSARITNMIKKYES